MSKARLVITAVTRAHQPVAQVAREYNVARSWIYELLARYREDGEAAFPPAHAARAPHTQRHQPRRRATVPTVRLVTLAPSPPPNAPVQHSP